MKIGLLSFEYPPYTGFGGIGTYTFYQAHALRQLGHEVHVIAGWTKPCALFAEEADGIIIWRGQSRIRPALLERFINRARLVWSRNRLETALSMFSALLEIGKHHKFDIVEMPECGAEGLLINHWLEMPTAVRFHSPSRLIMPYYDTKLLDRELCALLERIAMAGATGFTACAHFLADQVRGKMGYRKRSIETIHNGIDATLFDQSGPVCFDMREHFDLPRASKVILFSGRLEPRKGVQFLGPVLSEVLATSNAYAVIAGNDLFHFGRDTLMPLLASKGLAGRVRLAGQLSQPQIRAALVQADIFFLPSQWEACPYACLEAMAASKAIVASNAGGLPELLTHKSNALVVPKIQISDYIQALQQLLVDDALRSRLGENARQSVVNGFNDLAQAQRSIAFYNRCIR